MRAKSLGIIEKASASVLVKKKITIGLKMLTPISNIYIRRMPINITE